MAIIGVTNATGTSVRAQKADATQCADPQVAGPRDPTNPLALPNPPGADPLHGAHFFVDGPAHGTVAQAIETIVGDNTSYADTDTWAAFKQSIQSKIHDAATAAKVKLLEKIGDQEETNNISEYSQGGGRGAIFAQVTKIICHNMLADPTPATVPVLSTFFAYPNGQFCPSDEAIDGWWPTFKRLVGEMASAIGSARALILEEIDAVGTALCVHGGDALDDWLRELDYESSTFGPLPHAVSYLEAGSSDEIPAKETAKLLIRGGVEQIRGFFTNDTHFNWSSKEIAFGNTVSGFINLLSHSVSGQSQGSPARDRAATDTGYVAHFIVNTAQNGHGPRLNPHPVTQGIEDLCNPRGTGLGRKPTADTMPTFDGHTFKLLDAFMWTGVPGRSHGQCRPGDAPAGVFDPRFAMALSQLANQQLGPGYPGLPY
jgi:endoglucanase